MSRDLDDADWLAEQCETRSASSIARELGVAPDTVLRAMRLHQIPVRFATSKRHPVRPELDDAEWLADRYAQGSVRAIADELGVAEATVNRALQRHGIAIRDTSSTQRLRMPAELYDADWLREQYASKSGAQIADVLGVSKPAIHKAMARVGIDLDGSWVRRDTTRLTRPSTASVLPRRPARWGGSSPRSAGRWPCRRPAAPTPRSRQSPAGPTPR